MYKYNFMCFSVTFPYELVLYLDHIHPPFYLPFSSSLMPFPFLSISSLIFRPFLLAFPYMKKKNTHTHTCVFISFVSHRMLSSSSSHFPPNEGFCLFAASCCCVYPWDPHLLVEIPPHHCGIRIFTWIHFACLLSGCNIYVERGHVTFFCVIASFILSTGSGPL